MLNRDFIFSRYPWLAPDDLPHAVIIGDDLDAALSALLYLSQHPNARLVGVYRDFRVVHYSPAFEWKDVLGGIWLDLDIYHPACRSLGHHIVRLSADDKLPGFFTSCNLNEIVGRSVDAGFTAKYPLGTVHFLMWLYQQEVPNEDDSESLVWLADSAYINGQKDFKPNVENWIRCAVPLPSFLSTFDQIDHSDFDERMSLFQQKMSLAGFRQGSGQVRSKYLGLFGYQCQPQPRDDAGKHMLKVLNFAAEITGWTCRPEQLELASTLRSHERGARDTLGVEQVKRHGLDRFLRDRNVFSFVFWKRREINYTTGIDGHAH